MNKEDEKKNPLVDSDKQHANAANLSSDRHEDDDQHSYAGKLDVVEGQTNNGEIGGGIKKEE